ncbi:MAG TPA: glutathione S-transferase, partial [Gammaproteobacteria bacterium]|nr:glutathione S-transferase [Gammaproteobacteria bacterium]
MYTLYGSLGAASLTPQCVLEEAGAPYELIEVDISEDTERDPEYLKLNPHGRI